MELSKFQFLNQRITKLDYQINDKYKPGKIKLDINSKTNIDKDDEKKLAKVELVISIFPNDDINEVPFKINISNEGLFKWDDSIDNEQVQKFLELNSPSVLLANIRSVVSLITSYSAFPPLIIPLIDFTK